VFISKSTLVTAVSSQVVVINYPLTGSLCATPASNQIFWIVESSATLGVGSTFVGSILAQISITGNTGNTGVIVMGRLIALTGAVTIQSAVATVCPCDVCTSACGDPHFMGLDGVKYDFQGEPGKTFAIISDPSVEVNSVFTRTSFHNHTVLGDTCVHVCGHAVTMTPQQAVQIDGKELRFGSTFESSTITVSRPTAQRIEMTIPNRWNLRFSLIKSNIDDESMINLDHARPLYAYGNRTHGVLGHTLKGQPLPKSKCNLYAYGSCEVEGHFRDYEVVGGVCSSTWAHSFFDVEHC